MASNKVTDKYALLTSLTKEMRKSYIELDLQGRMSISYEAKNDAVTGDPCLRTEYRYSGPTSTVIIGVKETAFEWDSAFDATAGFVTT